MRQCVLIFILLAVSAFASTGAPPPTDTGLFKPSTATNARTSKKQLLRIYLHAGRNKTFYCGCTFDAGKTIDTSACGYAPRKASNPRSGKLEWQHAMPPAKFGIVLQCWRDAVCRRPNGRPFGGRKCCRKISPAFKTMAADMHNLFPSIGEITGDRAGYPVGEISKERRKYGECDVEINRKSLEPAESIRGDIARAYFYMSRLYGVPLRKRFEDMLRRWHLSDPPDSWEMDRNSLIEAVQGNRNPFIDHPERVEQVRDF